MEKSECPYCEEIFFGSYNERQDAIATHLVSDHAPEDSPSADNGFAPPRAKHTQRVGGHMV